MTDASFFKDAERWRLALEAILAGYPSLHQSEFCRDLARKALGNQVAPPIRPSTAQGRSHG